MNNSRDDFWDEIERQENATMEKIQQQKALKLAKVSHLNVCKRALYVALLNIPTGEWSDSDASITFELSKDPYIQSILERRK